MTARGLQTLPIAERLIVKSEGYTPYVYADPNGDATAGPGLFLHRGPPTAADIRKYGTKQNPKMTRREYFRLLDDLISKFERGVRSILRNRGIKVNACEFSALVSLAYNIGLAALAGSTVVNKLAADKRWQAGLAFMLWVFGNHGVPLPGLVIRRRRERRLFRGKHRHVRCGPRRLT